MKQSLKFFIIRLSLVLVRLLPRRKDAKGLLVARADNLGDLVISLPLLEKLFELFPNQALSLVVSESAAEFAQGLKGRGMAIDTIIVIRRRAFNRNPFYQLYLLALVHRAHYKTVLVPTFSRDLIVDAIVAASAAEERYAWKGNNDNQLSAQKTITDTYYTKLFDVPTQVTHEIERSRQLLDCLGAKHEALILPQLELSEHDTQAAVSIMQRYGLEKNKFVIIAPGAGASYRIWPLERFALIVRDVQRRGFRAVIVGTAAERQLALRIQEYSTVSVVELCGQTPIFTLAALLQRTALFVGSESGILQIAAAVETPAVCIMGGGHFKRFFPYPDAPKQALAYAPGLLCLNDNWACAKNLKPGECAPCIAAIRIDQVKEAIDSLITFGK